MNILLSAYACEPLKGSEPAVGWNYGVELAKLGHQVTVLTRTNNQTSIEKYMEEYKINIEGLSFYFYDCPYLLRWIKQKSKLILPYYFCWQIGAFFCALKLHEKRSFHLVHHITFASVRHFSWMWLIGIPFVLGPIGGGETSPFRMRLKNGLLFLITECIRDLNLLILKFDPTFYLPLAKAKYILVSTPETLKLIPRKFQDKAKCYSQIGLTNNTSKDTRNNKYIANRRERILFVGRLVPYKGIVLALDCFKCSLNRNPSLTMTLVGSGRQENKLKRYAIKIGVHSNLSWVKWQKSESMPDIYKSHGILLFPSLHDSAGFVVLEALKFGLPVVCLKQGGPGTIINRNIGASIDVHGRSYKNIIDELSKSIITLSSNKIVWSEYSARCIEEAEAWTWEKRISTIENDRKYRQE